MSTEVLRGKQVAEFLGICLSMLYKQMKNDQSFPKGKKLGKVRVWLKSDLINWIQQKGTSDVF